MDTLTERVPLEATYATGHLGVLAAIAAYRRGGPWLDQVRDLIARNSQDVHRAVSAEMPGVRYAPPASSYLGWLDFSETSVRDDPAAFFLEEARIGLSPGHTFGAGGEGFVRLNFGTSPAILAEILERMGAALSARGEA
ncbi:unannotated protein [freshwater metagenome]|uniref:Unannotated protein n=1 Tax=freshwater metagenome TaxID=449393 RepID=A0A6J7ESG4_9ZZZZ